MRSRTGPGRRAILAAPLAARAAGLIVIGVAAAVLAAWTVRMTGVTALPVWIYRTNPMTAVSLALAGAALLLPRTTRRSAGRALKLVIGCAIAAIAALKLTQLAAGQPAGVDLLLFPREVQSYKRSLMAPNTALALTLLAASLALSTQRWRMAAPAAQILAAGTLALAAMGLISYAYGTVGLIEFTNAGVMAFQTALALASAAVGVLWTRPRRALTGILTDSTLGGATARRLLPIIALTTVGLGAIRVAMARRGMLDEVNGVSLLITAMLITLVAVVLVLAQSLRRVSRRLAKREAALESARDAADAASRVKADFIANMSHEIRTPLTAIVGYADRLARRADIDAAARREIGRVDSAAQALLSIVNDVLDFSKLEAGQVVIRPSPVDPAALIAEAVHLFEQQAVAKDLEIEFRPRPSLPAGLLVDPDRLRQILLNLIGNAVKFTEKGSVIVVAGYDVQTGRLHVGVEDSGPGLTAAQRHLLFRRFSQIDASSTRRAGGTGLGLAICKGLVEAMNGEIGVRKRTGGGSVFYIRVPAPRAASVASIDRVHDEVRLDGRRVLIVDDDEANRDLVGSILSALGAEVVQAAGGREGVTAAAATRFDVILMDIRMPQLDGYGATAQIRAAPGPSRNAPIIAFSASIEPPSSSAGVEPAFSGFLRKPFVPEDLIAAIQTCLSPADQVSR